MRYFLSLIVALAWGLWFGGLVMLFITLSVLFVRNRSVAVQAAPMIIEFFEKYQLIVAAVALVTTVAWRLVSKQAVLTAMFVFFGMAAIGAVVNSTLITPKMESLRRKNESHLEPFAALHKTSENVYTAETVCVAIAGALLPLACRPRRPELAPSAGGPPATAST